MYRYPYTVQFSISLILLIVTGSLRPSLKCLFPLTADFTRVLYITLFCRYLLFKSHSFFFFSYMRILICAGGLFILLLLCIFYINSYVLVVTVAESYCVFVEYFWERSWWLEIFVYELNVCFLRFYCTVCWTIFLLAFLYCVMCILVFPGMVSLKVVSCSFLASFLLEGLPESL